MRSNAAIEISDDSKKAILNACVNWSIQNCVPFSTVEGVGFEKLIVEVLKIGACYGPGVDVKTILPHRTTVSNNISKLYEDTFPTIKKELSCLKYGAATTDMWTDQHKKLSYISAT